MKENVPFVKDLKKFTTLRRLSWYATVMHLLSFHSTEQVKVHLEEYFHKSQQAQGELDKNLCLLCIQCFEVMREKFDALLPPIDS